MNQVHVLWAIAILLFSGCVGRTAPPADVTSIPSEPELICPKYYSVSMQPGVYGRRDKDISNGVKCSDGKIYCFGDGQKPQPVPEAYEGYVCQSIGALCSRGLGCNGIRFEPDDSHRGSVIEDKTSMLRFPFCSYMEPRTTVIGLSYTPREQQFVWICEDKECICGGKSCPNGGQCYHEQCFPTGYDYHNDRELCDDDDASLFYSYEEALISHPHPLGEITPLLCDENHGSCRCGNETCALNTVCYQNQCVDAANLKPLPEGFVWYEGRPYCEREKCQCGKDICHANQWCIEGRCFDTPDVMVVDGKHIRYGFYSYWPHSESKGDFFDEESGQALPRNDYPRLDSSLWLDIILYPESALCDDPELPENLDDYICVAASIHSGCKEPSTADYSFYGWHCNRDEGCACGTNHCARHERCYHGKCLYDSIYLAMACGVNLVEWWKGDLGDAQVDENGWCRCGISHIPPYQEGYVCDDSAMQCWLKDGCACGNTRCRYEDYCLVSDKCMPKGTHEAILESMHCNTHEKCTCGDTRCNWGEFCVSPGKCVDYRVAWDYIVEKIWTDPDATYPKTE